MPDEQQLTCGQGLAEHSDAYTALTNEWRDIAVALEATADRMAGYRDLPMPPHDMAVLSGDEAAARFAGFLRAQRELAQALVGVRPQPKT